MMLTPIAQIVSKIEPIKARIQHLIVCAIVTSLVLLSFAVDTRRIYTYRHNTKKRAKAPTSTQGIEP